MQSPLPWAKPNLKTPPDARALCLLVVNAQIIAGIFCYNADKKKFFWDGTAVDLRDVELWLPFNALVATLPVTNQASVIARAAHIEHFLEQVAA